MNYADIKTVDVQDGTGVRVSIYVSGCHFHCKGCHNKEAWDFNYGKKFNEDTTKYLIELLKPSYIAGLSILGGEPLEMVNQEELSKLVKRIKEVYPNKSIWCYTGYKFEDVLFKMYNKFDVTKKLLDNLDIIVDGQFIEEKKIIDLKFRGSTNQNKIDVKESITQNKVVKLKFGDESRYEKDNSVIYKKFLFEDNDTIEDAHEENVISIEKYVNNNFDESSVNKKEYEYEDKNKNIAAKNILESIKNK